MLPSSFEYHRPATLDEALSLLATHGEDAKVLAGGQSLIPMMKLRFASPAHLIDVNRLPGLDGIEERDGTLRIGALVRHNHLAASDVIARYPTIAAAAPQIADPIVRNLGTIGGSLSHADPSGDLGSVMLALGASVVLKSSTGEREVPIRDFLVDAFQTSIAPGEMLTEIHVPAPGARSGGTLPEARTQGGRLRHGRGRRVPGARERIDRQGRHRPDVGRAHQHQGHRGRGLARGGGAR